jgi:iron-sulfur cluster repair protein YtfE (RIC family)
LVADTLEREVFSMSPALPIMRDETFLDEHRKIHTRLLRLQKFAARDSGFPSVVSALVACMDEIEGLVPELSDHFAREERVMRKATAPEHEQTTSSEQAQKVEQILSEHQPLLRELRALAESGREVVEELRGGRDVGSLAEALKVYLTACVKDLLDHEEKERTTLTAVPEQKARSESKSGG